MVVRPTFVRWTPVLPVVALLPLLALLAGSAAAQEPSQPFLSLDASGHSARVWATLFTPDDKELVTVSEDKTIRIWDILTGESLRTIRLPIGQGSEGTRYAAAMFKDGHTIAVGGYGVSEGENNTGAIYVVGLNTGTVLKKLTGHTDVIYVLSPCPDGRRLASSGADKTIRIWDIRTGELLRTMSAHRDVLYALEWSPDGNRVVAGSYDTWGSVWNVNNGQIEATMAHPKECRCVAWSPDGRTIATGCYDGQIRLWNTDGKLRATVNGLGDDDIQVTDVTFASDSRQLVYTLGSRTAPWHCGIVDVATQKLLVEYKDHGNTVMCGEFSHDNKLVASGDFLGEIHVWNANDASLVRRMGNRGKSVWACGWNKSGTMIAFGNTYDTGATYEARSKLERIFDLRRLELTDAPQETFTKANLVNGTLYLNAKSDTSVGVYFNNSEKAELAHETEYDRKYNTVRSFTLMSGQRAVVGTEFGLYLHDVHSGARLRTFQGHTGVIWAVSPSPDGKLFLSACSDQTMSLWNPDRESPLLTFFFCGDDWIVWTPEGYYAASAGGERLMGWHVNNGTDTAASYFPASQFRKTLYRPDIIKLIPREGSVELAVKAAGETMATAVADILPPTVLIATPERSPLTTEEQEVSVKAIARQVGEHPVTSMQVYLDGRPYGGRDGKIDFTDKSKPEIRHEFRVILTPGKAHQIAVRADSAVSHSMSPPIQVTYKQATVVEELPTLYVLAMGVSDYADEDLKLNFAANDAKKIEETFKNYAGTVYKKIETKLIINNKATRAGVLGGLQWLKKQMTQHDIGVVFFSGHGDKDDTGNFYLLPSDVDREELVVSAVSDAQIKLVLQGIPGRLLIMLDACHAGSLGGDRRKNSKSLTDDLVRDLSNDDYGVVVMASSMGREFSLESNQHQNGFFTVAVTEGLAGLESVDSNSDGLVYINELDTYVSNRVKDLTNGKQHPVTSKPATIRPFPLTKKR